MISNPLLLIILNFIYPVKNEKQENSDVKNSSV